MLRDNEWSAKLRGIVVDEAHCIKKWYEINTVFNNYSSIVPHTDL